MNTSVPLGEIALINPPGEQSPGIATVPFVPMSAVDAESASVVASELRETGGSLGGLSTFRRGDILFAKITPCFENGKIAQFTGPQQNAFGSTEFHVLRPKDGRLNPRFLVHLLRQESVRKAGEKRMTGSAGQRRVPRQFLEELSVPLLPSDEQRRIAEILDKADSLRAKRRAAIAKLDSLTQAIFLDMFGDPVKESRFPRVRVEDFVASFETGKSVAAEDQEDPASKYRVLKVSAVTSSEFRSSETKAAPPDHSPEPSHFVRPGDLLFSRANTSELVGATAYVFDTPDDLLLPDKLWRFVWRTPIAINPLWVWFLFRSRSFRFELGRRSTGTSGSMKNIAQDKVLTIETGLPSLVQQNEFAGALTTCLRTRSAATVSLRRLDVIFASLQADAFSGTVSTADPHGEA